MKEKEFTMSAGIAEIDVHRMNTETATELIRKNLKNLSDATYRIRIIKYLS